MSRRSRSYSERRGRDKRANSWDAMRRGKETRPRGKRLFVGGIKRVNEYVMKEKFETFGPISDIAIKENGYGFLEFKYIDDAADAVREAHRSNFFGEGLINVEYALSKERKSRRYQERSDSRRSRSYSNDSRSRSDDSRD